MCVAVPGLLVHRGAASGHSIPGRVAYDRLEREVDLVMVPEASPGDYVLVHSGYAVEILSEERARQTLDLLRQQRLSPLRSSGVGG